MQFTTLHLLEPFAYSGDFCFSFFVNVFFLVGWFEKRREEKTWAAGWDGHATGIRWMMTWRKGWRGNFPTKTVLILFRMLWVCKFLYFTVVLWCFRVFMHWNRFGECFQFSHSWMGLLPTSLSKVSSIMTWFQQQHSTPTPTCRDKIAQQKSVHWK